MSDMGDYFLHEDGRRSPLQLPKLREQSPSIGTDATTKPNKGARRTAEVDRGDVAVSGTDYSSQDMDAILTATVTTRIPPRAVGPLALIPMRSSPPLYHRNPAHDCLSSPPFSAIPYPDSLDAHDSELLPSPPPPRCRPRKLAKKATLPQRSLRKVAIKASPQQRSLPKVAIKVPPQQRSLRKPAMKPATSRKAPMKAFTAPRTPRAIICPNSLDAYNSELLASSPPPQRSPQKATMKAFTKASTAPRIRGLNLSSAHQQIFQTYFERGITNRSNKTLGLREEVQASTGLSMHHVNVYTILPPILC